ncbi:hypothetical protein N7541_000615 [Penicillium brevicompactum]|uniref:Uncharacterized protein n=1 Tax=Penicillium brevicompactum TaxID=5074 RepID=A0A9W9RWL9_PENBR|nr:hypothetical protein N7541_000615 [Penicillium brevicompactum]
MARSSISPSALSKLKELASWLQTAEMEEEEKNTFRCVDSDRHVKLLPLLDELGYRIKGHGYTMYRITGKAAINVTPKHRSFFFPLTIGSEKDAPSSELQVAGESLALGDFVHYTSPFILNTKLDFLIVLLPDPSEN